MKGVWRARIATRLNDVSPVNFLIAFHRGCQHNPLEESAVSKGVGLARSPWTFWKRGVSREWKVVDVHGEGRPRVCVNLSSVDVHVDFIRRRGIVGGGGTCYADLKIGRKEHSEEEGLERMCRNWKRGGWNDGNGKNYFSGMKYNFFFPFFFNFGRWNCRCLYRGGMKWIFIARGVCFRIIRLDVSWIYIFIQKDDIAFDKVESLSFVFSLKRKRIVFIVFDNLCFSILLFSFRK